MPVYNSEKTLAMAIESVINQSYRNLKLIIVDDASTDNSVIIAKKYLNDQRVSLFINEKNMGAYYSRNAGLYLYKDQEWGYFTTHDSDDISFEHRYIRLISLLKKNSQAIAVQDAFARVDFYTNEHLRSHVTCAHAVFKKEVFYNLGYFENKRFAADWEHWERVKEFAKYNNKECLTVKKVLGKSFIHENNLTVLIPGKSLARRKYVSKATQHIKHMSRTRKWYREFGIFSTRRET
jgi:glycosyltransferase involved in cell wall biosynthesis